MSEFDESAERLKKFGIVAAMLADGRSRLCLDDDERRDDAVKRGATIWTSDDMLRYVEMDERARSIFRGLKQTFRASSEWKEQ